MGFGIIICSCITAMFAIILLVTGLQYESQINANHTQCYINYVVYPTDLHSSVGFTDCDCGKYCTSDRGICISIFGNTDNSDDSTMFIDSVGDDLGDCTFKEANCREGESISDRLEAIANANSTVQPYLQSIHNNETIDCYEYNGQIYLNNDSKLETLIVIGSLTGFFLLISICCCYQERNGSKDKENTSNMSV